MSHFSVMVIGENPEQQLAPYHEFECTGFNDKYVQDVDITGEIQKRVAEGEPLIEALEYYGIEPVNTVGSETALDKEGRHKYGYAVVKDNVLLKAVDRTNPNKKWDWYVLGGRYSNKLLHKDGFRADALQKSDIDVEGIRNESERKARDHYREVAAYVGDLPRPDSWQSILEKHPGNVENARTEYHAQTAVKHFRTHSDHMWLENIEQYWDGEDKYAEKRRAEAFCSFAVVRDGVWHERGEMGWWGCVHDEKTPDDWQAKFTELFNSARDNELISIYDCHI